jgi:hypothetical protein
MMSRPAIAQPTNAAEEYAALLIGSFSSEQQANADARYDVVEARVVRIWPERADGVWLYQEQALLGPASAVDASARLRPYFQRIVHLQTVGPGLVRGRSHRMLDSAAAVGAWREPERIAANQIGEAICSGLAERIGSGFWRAESPDCPNAHRGAVRASSDSVRTVDAYVNWDRGWNAEGEQVWGPVTGGYIFERMRGD